MSRSIPNTRRLLWVVLATMWLIASARAESPTEPAQALAEALQAQRRGLSMEHGRLRGEGVAVLVERARVAQFVLIGEDHGFAEVPQFVQALDRALGADSPENLVIEIGPFAAERLSAGILAGDVAASARRYPGSTPFVEWADDAAMVVRWVDRHGAGALWGIDQEFVLAAIPNFERLAELAPDAAARQTVATYLARADAAHKSMLEEHDPSGVLMLTLNDADFATLNKTMRPVLGSETERVLAELAESVRIYHENETAPLDSNRHRSLLMKRLFMQHYRQAAATQPRPRAMFRMGAFHMGRGLTPTAVFDIGNLASELAESTGGHSFHVLVVAAGGTYNRKRPFLPDPALGNAPYAARDELAVLGVGPLLDQAFADRWTVFDMEPLRRQRAQREAGGTLFAKLVYAYDAVLVINRASAARDVLEGN